MTEKTTEKVEIFGQEYKIKGVGNPQYIHKIAGYVDKKMREIAHSSDIMSQSRIAILAALNIADEYYQEKEAKKKQAAEKAAAIAAADCELPQPAATASQPRKLEAVDS